MRDRSYARRALVRAMIQALQDMNRARFSADVQSRLIEIRMKSGRWWNGKFTERRLRPRA
jgi:hypothetical protein